jgi:hypothetical protein
MPTALMSGYGFAFGFASDPDTRSEVFDTMASTVPASVWGCFWFVVAVCCLVGSTRASWQWLRIAAVLGWALATGTLISVLWARFYTGTPISMVGISWAYLVWAACGYSSLSGHVYGDRRSGDE